MGIFPLSCSPGPEAGQALWKDVVKHREDPSGRDFALEAVSHQLTHELQVEQKFIIMNGAELSKFYGQQHRQRDPRLPTVKLMNEKGCLETYFVFKDHDDPFKRLKVITKQATSATTPILTEQQHVHEEGGESGR